MAATSIPATSGIKTNALHNDLEENTRNPTVEELLIQIENHLYKSIEHRASLLIAVWSCLAGKIGRFRNMEKVFQMLYRESAMTIFCGHWPKINIVYKRGLSKALFQFSHSLHKTGVDHRIEGAESLCSALIMATYDPWGDPVIRKLLSKDEIDQNTVDDFIKSEPFELLVIRVECLVNARFEEAAIRLCRCCLRSHQFHKDRKEENAFEENWRWTFMEWLLRLLFRKGRLNDLVAESKACSCHDGVRLIYRTRNSPLDDSEPLTETLINLFLVRDLLFQSNYCCTSELMSLWCDFQVHKQRTASEIQDAAHKLLVGHASSSAQFYLFVDILWDKFGTSLLPLYIEMYIRGLTSDLNYLEAARQADNKVFVIEIENHMAAMYFKLSSMFHNINKEIALECMLSSFSLNPTKERLDGIKKLTMQISKEKALKLAAAKREACKLKICNKTGCAYPHPIIPKKRAVIMCDQAIQVGDDSFENEFDLKDPSEFKITKMDTVDGFGNSAAIQEDNNPNKPLDDKTSDSINFIKENEISHSEKDSEKPIELNSLESDISSKTTEELSTEKSQHNERSLSLEIATIKENCEVNKTNHVNSTDVIVSENHCDSKTPEKNYVPHNGEICEDPEVKGLESCVNSKMDNDLKLLKDKMPESASPKSLRSNKNKDFQKEDELNNHSITENGFIPNSENDHHIDNVPSKSKPNYSDNNDSDIGCMDKKEVPNSNTCINGYNEIKDSALSEKTDVNQSNNQSEKIDNAIKDENSSVTCENTEINLDNSSCVNKSLENPVCENAENCTCKDTSGPSVIQPTSCENPQKEECRQAQNHVADDAERPIPVVDEEEIKSKRPFTHIILDSKISGLSDDLLSDFVIVLESLRNKQLKSSCKWSQIKHLCEDYLENVTHSRCMMLNMQANDSVDSEADSMSEITAFKGFESHQSDDSVVEDHYTNKNHVFKRFIHADNKAELATYVNLSDIHCPQIPLEKLFYTDHSSSRLLRKKRHKKHRNHEKNPEKIVLRKLRHSSRAERDLIKRKKRKKRKGKRAKNHLKKHHSAHIKTNKDYLKNKKKKHKLKKKKDERNSGFISGDYCSDFSSAELMRLVKEHSHSYTKLNATTSKHPHSVGSSSDEPARKKRKVTFDKKKQKAGKYHDKHKHQKSKSSKRKKKLAAIESCPGAVKNITDHALHGKIDAVKDYSRIVQYSSVKKMEAVQIRQRSLALNLSKVSQERESPNTMVDPCTSNSHLQQLVQQNFESSEDIMKMQLLMAQQQPEMMPVSSTTNFVTTANNQAVLKYVCSKMTSHLLSLAQSTSDSDGGKSSTPNNPGRTYQPQHTKFQPQNVSSNVKHVFVERGGIPYKMSSTSSSMASTIIPVSLPSVSTSDSRNLMGTVFTGGITYPSTVTPQVTTFTIPVAHNAGGCKLVTSKIVIPISQCGNIRTGTPTPIALPEADSRALAGSSGTPPIIILKNGNNTQIISGLQQPSAVVPCLPTARFPISQNRNRPSPTIMKTIPKIVKQAPKKLIQPVAKRPVLTIPPVTVIGPKPLTSANSVNLTVPVVSASLLAPKESEICEPENLSTSADNVSKEDTSNSSVTIKDSFVPELSETPTENLGSAVKPAVSPSPLEIATSQSSEKDLVSTDKVESSPDDVTEKTSTDNITPTNPNTHSSPLKDLLSSDAEVLPKPSTSPDIPKDDMAATSPKETSIDTGINKEDNEDKTEMTFEESKIEKEDDLHVEPEEVKAENLQNSPEELEAKSPPSVTPDMLSHAVVSTEKDQPSVHLDGEVEEIKAPVSVEKPNTPEDESDAAINDNVSTPIEDSKPAVEANKDSDASLKVLSAERTDHSPIKPINLTTGDQEKQLQPINDTETSSGKTSPKTVQPTKSEGGSQTSEAPTRSFTSISDAVRFSLMDMDDATDSVENQVVLQAFQASRASSPSSPAYAASESGEERNSASPSSSVMLSAPQSTSTTELNVSSRVSQRFETSVHSSQADKFTDCQSTVSRTISWTLDDNIADVSSAVTVQKSPDLDSCGENKEDDKPKKKRKKKERVDNDAVTHKFWCQICSKGFFSAYNLRRHCRNVHKMALPKGSSDVPFSNTSQCLPHIQQADTTTSETSSSRLSYGVQTSCVSPNKGSEYSMLSPSHETKNQEFSVKSGQHVPQIQSAEFQMQTPPRMTSQSSSTHVSPITPPKDFRLGTPTSVPAPQISPTKMSPVKSPSQPKFQRLPTGSQVPQMAKISQMQQIALCGQQALQQQRQIGQLQSSGLIQPLPSVACQAQQMQASQCPHFQANKQIVQQRIGQLQLMHHVAQLPSVPHAPHGIQKSAQTQSFKKCNTNQSTSKVSENEQMQQAAQLAQNQQLLANQQMQKLIQIRQNAIAASGIASQLSLANAIPSVPGSPVKGVTQCFQSQLAAARQAAVVGQIPTAQRAQGAGYNLPSHDTSSHQFFSPGVQPNQDQASCPHSSFSAQNISEFSANTPAYPTIRLSTEANDGLEDLEQFLLENMPWSGDQSSAHGMSQQSGNRPSSADSLTLTIPSQASTASQNRGAATKGKASISRPKPRKPVASPCSKNLLGNLGRGVKKKSCPKKISKASETECVVSKPEAFSQTNLVQPPPHELKQCHKEAIGNIPNFSKQTGKNTSVGMLNETDSSDSVQCINVTHNAPPKSASVGINFNIFSPVGLCTAEKSTDLMCNPSSCKETYDGQHKSSFLDHSNLAGTSSSNLDQNKSLININQCETGNPVNMVSAFNPTGKSSTVTMKPFCQVVATPYGITNETPNPQDIFLGQRNSETNDSNNSDQKDKKCDSSSGNLNTSATENLSNYHNVYTPGNIEKASLQRNLFLGGSSQCSEGNSEPDGKKEISENSVAEGVKAKSDSYLDANNNTTSETKEVTTHNSEDISNSKNDEETVISCTAPIENISHLEKSNSCDKITVLDELNAKKEGESLPSVKKCAIHDVNNSTIGEVNKIVSPKGDSMSESHKKCDVVFENLSKSDIIPDSHSKNDVLTENHPGSDIIYETQPKSDAPPKNNGISDETSNFVLKKCNEEKSYIPKVVNHDELSSHEDVVSNDENHLPKNKDIESVNTEIVLNRIALRVRKPPEASNKLIENDKNVPFFPADKDDIKNPIIKKNSKKRKAKQENGMNENIINDTKISYKLDGDNKVQKTSPLNNVNKEKDRSLCVITSCYDSIKKNNSLESDSHDSGFCLGEKQLDEISIDGIPAARLRLRDTPKTSVKRVCPCCVDAKLPKKCRANGGGNITKLIGAKVSNLKSKSTLKTKNTTNGHNGKVNTRSSQRLRSRNNAIS